MVFLLFEYRSEDAIRKEQQRDAELKEQQESWNVGTSDGRGSSEVPSWKLQKEKQNLFPWKRKGGHVVRTYKNLRKKKNQIKE